MSIRFECFGMTILKARAVDLEMQDFEGHTVQELAPENRGGVLILYLPNDGTISLFMPYSSALEYANALNACNDREAAANDDQAAFRHANRIQI